MSCKPSPCGASYRAQTKRPLLLAAPPIVGWAISARSKRGFTLAHVLLMNPNHNPATTTAMCQIAAVGLGAPPTPWTAPSGPDLITDPAALADAADLIASAALPLWPDGIIVSAFGDPGAARLAQRAPCPVIGIGAAAARQAAQAGQPFAVATTTPALAAPIDALMMAHAGNATYVGCFCADADPAALMSDQGALDAALLAQINRAYAAGAACVIIGGGPLGTAAERLRAASPVPLINPILSAARALRLLIESEHA